jgi:hypothetical protein
MARDYGTTESGRTLEWACALAVKDGTRGRELMNVDEGDQTDEESHEAITPESSLSGEDRRWTMKGLDDDVMRAALALCGLGRCQ